MQRVQNRPKPRRYDPRTITIVSASLESGKEVKDVMYQNLNFSGLLELVLDPEGFAKCLSWIRQECNPPSISIYPIRLQWPQTEASRFSFP